MLLKGLECMLFRTLTCGEVIRLFSLAGDIYMVLNLDVD